ncbi:hypothetical protein P691DRAFT_697816 [Macrolepiota fuliginosa MF-IS2]|uniref:Uncharacterized protein n=1 Tax=Macrolepiota fuliginosa MF-IS2 TaxID=1400762 RepID=A0A9P5XJJ5_9AGAR|nr:hypothetical protein P691DRAFT_697816 [Macrolepiota fuliginosa MF-IS2]
MSGSPLPQDFSFEARDVILNMTLIESFGDGIYSAVFWFTMYMLVAHKKAKRTPRRLSTFLIIIPLYILAMIHLSIRWTVARRAFVVDGDTASDVLNSFLTQPTWCIALSVVSFSLMTLIADFVTIWRCWVIWGRDWRVVVAPILMVLAGAGKRLTNNHAAFCIMAAVFQIDPSSGLATSQFNKFAKFSMIYFVFSLCSTAISTTLIVYRIIAVSRETGFSTISPYRKILEIIIESAALYCIALIVYLPLLVRDDFSDGYAQALLISITGIAPTIITARVSLGVARDYTTVHPNKDSAFVAATAITVSTSTASKTLHSGSDHDFSPISSKKKGNSDYDV